MFSMNKTILMDAAEKGNVATFEFLLKLGASKDLRCRLGRSISDYIKMDVIGKSLQAKQQMNRVIYRDFLLRSAMPGQQ